MAGITGAGIRRGDILLCKSYSLLPTTTHLVIRAGQFAGQVLGGNAPLGESNTVHAQIALSTGQTPASIAESDGSGLHVGTCTVEADVFRLGDASLRKVADTAAQVAEDLVAKTTGTDGYYCSMFVTVCYQVAALRCNIPVPTILNGDAMNMSPSDLESYLNAFSNTWTFVGTLNLPSGDAWDRWRQRVFSREHSH